MKRTNLIGGLFLAISLLASCSREEVTLNEDGQTPPVINPEGLVFKTVDLQLNTKLGNGDNAPETRSANDVDELGRPKGEYPLKNIYLVRAESKNATAAEYKKMDIATTTRIAYAFVDNNGRATVNQPTHVFIVPVATQNDPSTGVVIKLSPIKGEIKQQMTYNDFESIGDMFYYLSTDQKEIELPTSNANFYHELGDQLFHSANYLLAFDKEKQGLVAFNVDLDYQLAFPANVPGTEIGGLWPIYVNRFGAALSLRFMVTGDYYDKNINDTEAIKTAFESKTGFSIDGVYSSQAFIGNFPIICDVQKSTAKLPLNGGKIGDLLVYNREITSMKPIEFKYADASQFVKGMGLVAEEVPFVYPLTFSSSNSFNITIGVKHGGKNVSMNFKISMANRNYSLTANTNTIFYLKMTIDELKKYYEDTLNKAVTRSAGETVIELPASALEVVNGAI